MMDFEIVSDITNIVRIASGNSIRDLSRLNRQFGKGRWRKLKGVALVRLEDESIQRAEIHWYEAHGIGRRGFKIKRYLARVIKL
jgi:hypothetical protein